MAKRKPVNEMSAEELYELARQKEQQEFERQKEQVRAQIEELRAKRREMVVEHRRQLAEIDREIKSMGGRVKKAGGTRGGRGGAGISAQVLSVLGEQGEASTNDIRGALEQRGVSAGNLGQTLAYLKRTGRVTSPRRSVYKLA